MRSTDSPTQFLLDLDLPAGAELATNGEGGATISDATGPLVTVDPGRALDAASQEAEVDYTVDGGTLTVHVHPGDQAVYPIMVDPAFNVVDQYNWGVENAGNPNPNPADWWWATPNANHFSGFYATNEGGIRNRALGAAAGRQFSAGEYAEWGISSYRESSIEEVDFFNFDHSPTSPGTCTQMGIWQPDQWSWTGSNLVYNPQGNPQWYGVPNIEQVCGNVSHATRYFIVGFSPNPDGAGGDPEAALHSMGIFALRNSLNGSRYQDADNLLRSAYVQRVDTNNPTISLIGPITSGWTNQPYSFRVQDPGLGAQGVWLWEGIAGSLEVSATGSNGCTGAHQRQCPTTSDIAIADMPEGKHSFTAVGIDPVLNGSAGIGFTARFDQSPPLISASGGLTTEGLGDPNVLHVDAVDGDQSDQTGERWRSGVRSIDVQLNGQTVAATGTQPCTAAQSSCPLSLNYAPTSLPSGPLHFKVTATDQLGQTAIQEWDLGKDILLSGILAGPDGQPTSGVVRVYPADGEGTIAPLGTATAGSSGAYTVPVASLAQLRGLAAGNHGWLNVDVISETNNAYSGMEGVAVNVGEQGSSRVVLSSPVTRLSADAPDTELDRDTVDGDPGRASQGAAKWACPPGGSVDKQIIDRFTKPVVVGELNNAYGSDGTTASFRYGEQADTVIQKGISWHGDTFQVAGSTTIANGLGLTVGEGPRTGRFAHRVSSDFRFVEGRSRWCDIRYDPPKHKQRFGVSATEWLGGAQTEAQDGLDRCPKRNRYDQFTFFSRREYAAEKWETSASVLGLGVSSRSGYSQFVKTKFDFGSTPRHYLCGVDGDRNARNSKRILSGAQ